ncbi:hypothetical protein ACIBK9_12120 [Nonomuraea sp. NPDC050227]|uniref:hypothetical protein n=1 Tax=Nonomuraea sp. NPDC050227 TaxID=3364360 RepID=UPI0037933076
MLLPDAAIETVTREPDGTIALHHHDTRIRLGAPQHASAHCFHRFQTSGAKS